MKKLFKRVFGIAASAALLVTSSMTAFADEPTSWHSHRGKDTVITFSGDPKYTITLTKPTDVTIDNGEYGAYQIFTGTVKDEDYTGTNANPGNFDAKTGKSTAIPITDIKWGNAFGVVNSETWQNNIVNFVLALAAPYKGDGDKYAAAFANFNGFEKFKEDDYLADTYYIDPNTSDELTNDEKTNKNVNFDKLATAVADVVAAHNDREWLQAFTDILGGYGEDYGESTEANKGFVTQYYKSEIIGDDYKIGVPASGYYMILDSTGIADDATDKAYSARMLFVVNDVKQELKEDIPTLDKKVVRDDEKLYETEAAGVGDDVKFRLTGTLPDNYDQYTLGYKFTFTDTLSKGLTLKELTSGMKTYVTVKVKNVYNAAGTLFTDEYTIETNSFKEDETHTHITKSAAYKEEYNEATNVLTVTFPCLKEIVIKGDGGTDYYIGADSEIYIDYTAVVNENAIVSPDNGNENTAVLTYSDNPQAYDDTDDTTKEHATVYTFGLDIVKVDAAEYLRTGLTTGDAALKGAKFVIVRPNPTDATKYQIAKLTKFEKGTTEEPTEEPRSFEGTYYSIDEWTDLDGTPATDAALQTAIDTFLKDTSHTGYEMETVDGGKLLISGLDDGITYTMVETATPKPSDKYAKINPFTVTLTAAKDEDNKEYTGKLSNAVSDKQIGEGKSFSFDNPVDITANQFNDEADSDGSANMIVANFKYIDLPSTGGVGTYLFYILGAGGLAISFLLFKMSRKKAVN